MPDLPRILVYGGKNEQAESLASVLAGRFAPVRASQMEEALQLLRGGWTPRAKFDEAQQALSQEHTR